MNSNEKNEGFDNSYSSTIIKLDNVVKTYDNEKIKALNGINLEIAENDFISVIGPSGSGKSTLLNIIGAIDEANSGNISVSGVNLNNEKYLNKFRSEKIGFIFQLHNLIPNLTVLENVQIPLIGTGINNNEIDKRALDMLNSVGLADKINQMPTKLSGGERQRVAIARALVNNPSIILADEPTGSLDSKTGDLILNLLKNIHKKNNVTLIIVTHEPYVANMANRIIKVVDGRIVDN